MGFSGDASGKEPACQCRKQMQVRSLGQEDPLEKEMETHSDILAWRLPWTEEPGGLQSVGSQRVGHDWATEPDWTELAANQPQQYPPKKIFWWQEIITVL